MELEEAPAIPVAIRRALYYVNVVLGMVLFVIMSAIGAGLVSGDVVSKWVAFVTALTTTPGGLLALVYSRGKA